MAKYTTQERKRIREELSKIKAGGFGFGTTERGLAFLSAINSLAVEFGRSRTALRTELYRLAGGYKKQAKKEKMIVRGARKFTPEGLLSAQKHGRARWEKSMAKLRAYGPTEEQIKAAFTNTKVKLGKTVWNFVEENLEGHENATFNFFKTQEGWKVQKVNAVWTHPTRESSVTAVMETVA